MNSMILRESYVAVLFRRFVLNTFTRAETDAELIEYIEYWDLVA